MHSRFPLTQATPGQEILTVKQISRPLWHGNEGVDEFEVLFLEIRKVKRLHYVKFYSAQLSEWFGDIFVIK